VDAERLKDQAARCRRLAALMTDREMARILRGVAEECDAQLAKMTAGQEAEPPAEAGITPAPPPAMPSPLSQPTPPMEPEKGLIG